MIDPRTSTVVAWYGPLPAGLDALVVRVQAQVAAALGAAFTIRDPAQVHATLIGLERAAAPFDPAPLAAHLATVLTPGLTVRFGGFAPTDRRFLSRGRPLHERSVGISDRVVLMGWPVIDDAPCAAVADVRRSCAAYGVTHRYGQDPDVYLVLGGVAAGRDVTAVEAAVRDEVARRAIDVPLSPADLSLVTYADPALPLASSTRRPLTSP